MVIVGFLCQNAREMGSVEGCTGEYASRVSNDVLIYVHQVMVKGGGGWCTSRPGRQEEVVGRSGGDGDGDVYIMKW